MADDTTSLRGWLAAEQGVTSDEARTAFIAGFVRPAREGHDRAVAKLHAFEDEPSHFLSALQALKRGGYKAP